MASSARNFCLLALAMGSALAAEPVADDLLFSAQSLDIDSKTSMIALHGPQITQRGMKIEADDALATTTDFEARSEWHLTGHVRMTLDTAAITSDSAVFTFADKRLSRGELSKATFENTRVAEGKTPVNGGADKVFYDYTARTLRLSGNAWVHKDQYEINGCDLLYDLKDERVSSGSADCDEPFRVKMLSQQGAGAAPDAPPQ